MKRGSWIEAQQNIIWLGTEFCFVLNGLRTVSIIPRKKALILRHSEVHRRVNSEARNGTKVREKNNFTKQRQKSSFLILVLKFSAAAF
jgi:hypothetical protein